MASRAHVSSDLKEYLLETLPISIRWLRFPEGDVTRLSSGGLQANALIPLGGDRRICKAYSAYRAQRKCRNSSGVSPVNIMGLSSDRPSTSLLPCGKENMVIKLEESLLNKVRCTWRKGWVGQKKKRCKLTLNKVSSTSNTQLPSSK